MELDNNMRLEKPGELLEQYQSGQVELDEEQTPKVENAGSPDVPPRRSYRDILRSTPLSNIVAEDYTEEAKREGFGLSRYDTDYYPELDVEESRAVEQSGFSKIGTGIVKGGITAATTAVNTTLGTVFGLGSSLFELAADANGNGRSVMDTLDAGVNNWLSNQLVKIQQWSETQLPNYRTAEERSEKYQREWWKHMGTANFIGDSILKNFGFTVGAMAGGMAWSKLIGAGLSKQLANNIMKGAVAAAEGDSEAATLLRSAAEAVKNGTATEAQAALARAGEAIARGTAVGLDADALVANIERAATALNKYGAKLSLYGAVVGAMGEGTVEGIMARNEFMENFNRDWNEQYDREYNGLEQSILESGNPDWVEEEAYERPDGSIGFDRRLTSEGYNELDRRRYEVTQKYNDARSYAEQQGDRLSSTTFLLNLPILTVSNTLQFGRMLSGGWNTSRNASKGVIGKLKQVAGKLQADYSASGNVATRTLLNSLKVGTSESFEEMAQGTVASGAKAVAEKNLASFNNAGFDPEAINSVRDWFSSMYEGGREYLSDPKNWQEGAIGALTGLFGIPGRRWNGGVFGAYRDAKERTTADQRSAEALNNLVNSDEFQNRWRGYIRHLKYDNDMEKAVADDDEYAWHTADDNQMISDVIMFADAGRLEDLNRIVEYYGGMTLDDAAQLKDAMKDDKNAENDWVRNSSPAEIVDKVKKQAERIKTTVDQYKRFYDAMKARAPQDASPELIKEMVFTAQQIKAYESRFLQMFGETMQAIDDVIEIQSVFAKDGTLIEDNEQRKKRYEEVRNSYERIFSMMGLPIRIPKAMRDETNKILDVMEGFAEGDTETVKKIQDMRKLANSRNVFYEKLMTLQGEAGQQKHEQQAQTQQEMDEKSIEQMADIETDGLDTFDSVKQAYHAKNAREKAEFLASLEKVKDKKPAVKAFLELKRRFDVFQEYYDKNGASSDNVAVTPRMLQSMINDLLHKATSLQDLETLPDGMFMPVDQFIQEFSGIIPTSAAVYTAAKQAVRDAMRKFQDLDSSTGTRKTMPATPAPTPSVADDAKPTGTDASQPGSTTPKPSSSEASDEEKVIKKGIAGVGEGLKEAFETGKKARQEEWINNWLRTPTVADAFRDYGKGAKSVDEVIQRVLDDNPDAPKETVDALHLIPKFESSKAIVRSYMSETGAEPTADTYGDTKPVSEEAGNTKIADDPTDNEIAETAFVTEEEERPVGEETEPDGTTPYYHTSIPEIDSEQAKLARSGIAGRRAADLSDFVEKHPEYAELWNALHDAGAFAYVATQLSVGDEIEFVIDPSFPKWKGRHQILMCTTRQDGKRQILTVLSSKNADYLNLRELKDEIEAEYRTHLDAHPNEVFVFSKKSTVWAKRAGQIDYDFASSSDPFAKERGLKDTPGYSEDAPLVFINRNGKPQVVRGDNDALTRIGENTFSDAFATQHPGALYYMADRGDGVLVPVRLFVEHFTPESLAKRGTNPMFLRVRMLLSLIAKQAASLDKTTTNIEEENNLLRSRLQDLAGLLDIHDLYFEFGTYPNIGRALKIVTWSDDGYGNRVESHDFRRPDQITEEWLTSFVAEHRYSFQIKQDKESGSVKQMDDYVDNAIVTTNARMLRPKGVDFYVDPWDKDAKEFKPATSEQVAAHKAARARKESEQAPAQAPIVPPGLEGAVLGVSSTDDDLDWSDADFNDPSVRRNQPARKEEGEGAEQAPQTPASEDGGRFGSLDKDIRDILLSLGWKEEEFNEAAKEVQDYAIACAGSML